MMPELATRIVRRAATLRVGVFLVALASPLAQSSNSLLLPPAIVTLLNGGTR